MESSQLNWIAGYIWGIADDVLRDLYVRGKITNQDAALRQASGQAFFNASKFTLRDLRARASQQQLRADFEDYLDGFSSNVSGRGTAPGLQHVHGGGRPRCGNLFRMRQLYETYRNDEKVSPLVRQLPWTHNLLILALWKDPGIHPRRG